jgi:hypothetical protein
MTFTHTFITRGLERARLPIHVSFIMSIDPARGGHWLIEDSHNGAGIACMTKELAYAWYRVLVAWHMQDREGHG